ncbi:MAG: hypothetical protein ACK4I0_00700 [Brevundimonas sp.]
MDESFRSAIEMAMNARDLKSDRPSGDQRLNGKSRLWVIQANPAAS